MERGKNKLINIHVEKQRPKIGPWGTLCFTVPHFEENPCV
jgi:hypothetical protein